MGLRDQLRKVFGPGKPVEVAAGEAVAGMDHTRPFSPGEPIGPYDGYSRTPRSKDFVTGYNIATRPRTHERVAFDTLRGLIEAYDIAQICIWHRIDSIRALDWSLVPTRGFKGDAEDAISVGMAVLDSPDHENHFDVWLAKWLYDILAYDAGCLSRMRNRGGRVIGLSTVDGTTIAPLLDYWGNSPKPPAEAYVQYVNGLPWNWLTRNDLIYQPFRPRTNSLYGVAPLETILLNANTDLRFQAYFLQRFTAGNVPRAFMTAPETWTPDQIEHFQTAWDAFMVGDQSMKHQIRWIPGGSGAPAWVDEKPFEDNFSLFLMRKTASAYHVVPADLGYTESVNKSSGETQADVQHRVGDLPLASYVAKILTQVLHKDLGLPLDFQFDLGQEKEDRLALAQAWKIYVDMGAVSSDEMREELVGLPADPHRPTPRFITTSRLGPVPLLALEGVAGKVDPETYGPAADQHVLVQPYVPPPGVIPEPGTVDAKASLDGEDRYQTKVREALQESQGGELGQNTAAALTTATSTVAKEGEAGPTAGITSDTGLYSYDLIGQDDDEDEDEQRAEVAKELAAFGRYRRARVKAGKWRDFGFRAVDTTRGRRLNQAGRADVRKAAGEPVAAGLCVVAEDTGRILMLQRALNPVACTCGVPVEWDPSNGYQHSDGSISHDDGTSVSDRIGTDYDPAAGYWEIPGGCIDQGEEPLQAAWREFAEEVGRTPPPGKWVGAWTSADGVYVGTAWQVPSETYVPIDERDQVSNPDDPDGDQTEAVAWWDPTQLAGNPAVRPELLANLTGLLDALGIEVLAGDVAKAGDRGDPKGGDHAWHGWTWDHRVAAHYGRQLADTAGDVLTEAAARQLVRDYQAEQPGVSETDRRIRVGAVRVWLASKLLDLSGRLHQPLTGLVADAYLVGTVSAGAAMGGERPNLGGWQPGAGDTRDRLDAIGVAAGALIVAGTVADIAERVAGGQQAAAARALIDGIDANEAGDAVAQAMRDAATDLSRAEGAALTEVTTASSLAALDVYDEGGATQVQWVVDPSSNVCAACQSKADEGPVPFGRFTPPPGHPRCRCSISAAWGGRRGG